MYQVEDGFAAELNDVEVFRTKHQHLATSHCQIKLAEARNRRNEFVIEKINELKTLGIL